MSQLAQASDHTRSWVDIFPELLVVRDRVYNLNTSLTVIEGCPLSHQDCGWTPVVQRILKFLLQGSEQKRAFLIWGKEAKKLLMSSMEEAEFPEAYVVTTSHPSPLSASKTRVPFLGSGCFQRMNDYLRNWGGTIQWTP